MDSKLFYPWFVYEYYWTVITVIIFMRPIYTVHVHAIMILFILTL